MPGGGAERGRRWSGPSTDAGCWWRGPMSAPQPSERDTIRRLDSFRSRRGFSCARVERLVQDAGERVYFRVHPESGEETLVLCVMSRPYEPGTLPFANSAALYRELGVGGPRILEEAPDLGVVVLEDLGDDLLQTVARRGEARTGALYAGAVEILARIQREGARLRQPAQEARFRAFSLHLDPALFLRELRFFVDHFLEGYLHVSLGERGARELDGLFGELATEAASGPEALCHRDFHSRNLMAGPASGNRSGAALRVIDHQDTRLGPRGYDLMSLVRDPYVAAASPGPMSFSLPFAETELVTAFSKAAGFSESPAQLAAEFDAVALQRHLKALGTYGFQVSRRHNDVYRDFIAPTAAMVRENLDRHGARSERRRLRGLLSDLMELC